MQMTVDDLIRDLQKMPRDFTLRISIPCRQGRAFGEDIEKDVTNVKVQASRKLVVIETAILDLGPK